MTRMFVPELFSLLKRGYRIQQLPKDVMAGVIVGIVALPLAIAFAIASGVEPAQGIFTAVVAGFIVSALSGSKVQIGGPTGAFIVIVFDIVHRFGYQGLATATFMAGILLILMGLARLGTVIKFIPYPMTVGFTSGIAVIIAGSQIKDLLGLPTTASSNVFIEKMALYIQDLPMMNTETCMIGLMSFAIILIWQKYNKIIPGSIIAIIVCTAGVHLLHLDVPTIGTQFGEIPRSLPSPTLPTFDLHTIRKLFSPALTIALLAAIESLLSAVVADGMIGTRHNSNMELVCQGVANMVSPLFGGIPATGAIARTATNIKNGGSSPVAGMVHALTLLVLLLFLAPLASLIPLATLSAILLVVAYHMSEWRHFIKLFHSPKSDILVMLSTFGLTVFVDLTVAIEVGVVLSSLLFMKRMADTTEFQTIGAEMNETYDPNDFRGVQPKDIPRGVQIFEIHGPFFFGAANKFKDTLSIVKGTPSVLILRMRHILFIDATALRAFEEVLDKSRQDGTRVLLSGVRPELKKILVKSGVMERLGEENIFPSIESALERARGLV
ncbi:MAG: sulfate permease [Proteobacteria bacterium]|nr:sulfate permease [Pseudomonadota bacterium]